MKRFGFMRSTVALVIAVVAFLAAGTPVRALNVAATAVFNDATGTYYNTYGWSSDDLLWDVTDPNAWSELVHARYEAETWGGGNNFEATVICRGLCWGSYTNVIYATYSNPYGSYSWLCDSSPSGNPEQDISVDGGGSNWLDFNANSTYCGSYYTMTNNLAAADGAFLITQTSGSQTNPAYIQYFKNQCDGAPFQSYMQEYVGGGTWSFWLNDYPYNPTYWNIAFSNLTESTSISFDGNGGETVSYDYSGSCW